MSNNFKVRSNIAGFHFPLLQQGHVVIKLDESLFLVNVITESLQLVDLKFLFSIPEFVWFLTNVVAPRNHFFQKRLRH